MLFATTSIKTKTCLHLFAEMSHDVWPTLLSLFLTYLLALRKEKLCAGVPEQSHMSVSLICGGVLAPDYVAILFSGAKDGFCL